MNTPSAAGIYARISSDVDGTGLGVQRQVEDCRKLAKELGWPVREEYVDNDVSAYSGKKRPSYQRMLQDITDGLIDAVLVYHIDRLTRRPIELEEFIGVLDAAKVTRVRFVTGDTDLASGDGLLMARIMGAVAANESASKSRRLRRKHEQIAAEGRPNGGARRPFGYTDDKLHVVPEEAHVIQTLAGRFLAGESLRSLSTWLAEQNITTVYGLPWRTSTLHSMLASPRLAGLRSHRGVVVGAAVWPAILDEDTHRRVVAKFAAAASSRRRTPQRYLLSGMLRCGKCGKRLFSSARQHRRRYVCMSGPDHGGCGRLTVVADPVERLIADAVLYRLDTAELAEALAGRTAADEQAAAVSEALAKDRQQLDELARAHGENLITMREWLTARKPIEQRIDDAERKVSRLTRTDALVGVVGEGEQLRGQWASLNLSRQRAIVEAVFDHAVIGPGKSGARTLDPDRVQPVWRL